MDAQAAKRQFLEYIETEIVVAVVVPVVVDVETLGVEIADVDVIAIRVDICPPPSVSRICGTRS